MDYARAAVAGVLSAGLVFLVTREEPLTLDKGAVAFIVLVATIALLVGVDVIRVMRRPDQ